MINDSDLSPKQKANLDAIIEILPDILSENALKAAKPTQFVQIIFDIESDTPDEIALATKVSDEKQDIMPGAAHLRTLPSVGDSPTIQLFAMDIRA